MKYAIEYEYPDVERKVGRVYVQRVADVIPGYMPDAFSYTKDAAQATTWPTEADANAELHRWLRNAGRVVAVVDA